MQESSHEERKVDDKYDKHNSNMRGENIQIDITSDIELTANSPEEGRTAKS